MTTKTSPSTLLDKTRISTRLAVGYAIVLLFLASVVIVAVYRLDRMAATTKEVIEGDAARATLANAINLHAESSAGRLALLFILQEKDQRVAVYREMDNHNSAIDQAIEQLTPLLTQPEEKTALARVTTLRETYREKFHDAIEALELNDREAAEKIMVTSTRMALHDLLDETSRLDNLETLTRIVTDQARESAAIAANVRSIIDMAENNHHAAEFVASVTGKMVILSGELQTTVKIFRH